MAVSINTDEVRQLAADMRAIDTRLARWVRPVIERGAVNIKNDLQAKMRSSTHFAPVASGISYDIRAGGFGGTGVYEAEIGPTRGRPGSLANIAYFGTPRGGGTVEDPTGALEREAPTFAEALADLAADLVLEP